MTDDVLRCPHCHARLERMGATLHCAAGHAFDVARQGHVNLLPRPSPHAGDSAAMLDARDATLRAGHLDVVTDAVVRQLDAADLPAGVVVEAGAGTGHHLGRVLEATGRAGVALDVSKHAARRAARASPAITSVVADVWQPWPVLDEAAAAVLHVFAPRNVAEAHRVLTTGGAMVVTVPTAEHLQELAGPLGLLTAAPTAAKVPDHPGLTVAGIVHARAARRLSRAAIRHLVAMGPNAHHLAPDVLAARVEQLGEVAEITISVDVLCLRKTALGGH